MAKETEKEEKKELKPTDPRQERWEAFLKVAEEQRRKFGSIEIFNAQKALGEFDKIPDDFK